MIETAAGVLTAILGALVVGLLVGAVVMGLKRTPPALPPHRDLCKRGCGIVHVLTCGNGIILEGLPLHCERAYCHPGRHEAGEDMDFRCWPNRDDPEDAVERSVHGPPFAKMIL